MTSAFYVAYLEIEHKQDETSGLETNAKAPSPTPDCQCGPVVSSSTRQ